MVKAVAMGRRGLLVVSAVVATVGAALGAVKALVTSMAAVILGLPEGFGAYLLLWDGTEVGVLTSCAIGGAGAGFAFAGKASAAALLMLTGATGVVASAAAYVLLQPAAIGSAFEPYLSPGLVPDSGWHAVQLFPVPLLLIGAVLAGLARSR